MMENEPGGLSPRKARNAVNLAVEDAAGNRGLFNRRLSFLLIPAAALLAYINSLNAPFIFDDVVSIVRLPSIAKLTPVIPTPRFLVDLSFKLNYAADGLNVAGYHVVNIAIHMIAGLLLYGIIRRTFLFPVLAAHARAGPWIALAAAVLWTVHPMQTESVTYVCQRYESAMGMFYLLCLYGFIRGASEQANARLWCDVSLAACLLGAGTKEVIATAPLAVLLYDSVFVSGSLRRAWRGRRMFYAALASIWLVLGLLVLRMMADGIARNVPVFPGGSRLAYLVTQFGVIAHYLRLAVVPWPLCLDYAWPEAQGLMEVLPQAVLIGALGIGSGIALWRGSPFGFLAAFFFMTLAPSSSVIPIHDAAVEHRMYLPLCAVVVAAVASVYVLVEGLLRRLSPASLTARRVLYASVSATVAACFMGLTFTRNRDYRSELAMWQDVAAKRPDNLRARLGVCSGLMAQQRYAEAERHCCELLALLRGNAHSDAERARDAQDRVQLEVSALNNLGVCRFCRNDVDGAIALYRESLRRVPGYQAARENLGLALMRKGETNEAGRIFMDLLVEDPENAYALWYRITVNPGGREQ